MGLTELPRFSSVNMATSYTVRVCSMSLHRLTMSDSIYTGVMVMAWHPSMTLEVDNPTILRGLARILFTRSSMSMLNAKFKEFFTITFGGLSLRQVAKQT